MPFCTSFLATGELKMTARISKTQSVSKRSATRMVASLESDAVRVAESLSPQNLPRAPALQASPDVFESLTRYGFSDEEIFALVVPRRTFARRQAQNERLTVEETDKALRLARIATQAEIVFGDKNKAHRWLRKPKRSLNGETPLAYLASEAGARTVEEMLNRIEFGVLA
jgi:putative toxin-antitoxin system antitoxin component (TIGR02293 family)